MVICPLSPPKSDRSNDEFNFIVWLASFRWYLNTHNSIGCLGVRQSEFLCTGRFAWMRQIYKPATDLVQREKFHLTKKHTKLLRIKITFGAAAAANIGNVKKQMKVRLFSACSLWVKLFLAKFCLALVWCCTVEAVVWFCWCLLFAGHCLLVFCFLSSCQWQWCDVLVLCVLPFNQTDGTWACLKRDITAHHCTMGR